MDNTVQHPHSGSRTLSCGDRLAPAMPICGLLTTKLHIPQCRADRVARPQLMQRLDDSLSRPLTLVAAPPGYGKTTLVATWAATQHRDKVAWLSLDAGDNDPARFLTYLLAALHKAHAQIGAGVRELLPLPQQTDPTTIIVRIINDLMQLPGPLMLVIDDYHIITTAAIHDLLTLLIDRIPPQLHITILSRADPPLPLFRWRARGQVTELRAADLRFTHAEVAAFLHQNLNIPLAEAHIAALESRTEGWIAGLQLAALSLQECDDCTHFVAEFAGNHHYILDYLVGEVLDHLPAPVRDFLLFTSVLNRMSADLCDVLLDVAYTMPDVALAAEVGAPTRVKTLQSQPMLAHLERMNLFVVPLDNQRRWYRYHHLFADLLRHHLQATHPDLVPKLHRRAAEWHTTRGVCEEAITHALAAEDYTYASMLIENVGRCYLRRGEVATVRRWLAKLPTDLITTRPQLGVLAAWGHMWSYQPDAVEHMIQQVQRLVATQPDEVSHPSCVRGECCVQTELLALQAFVARCRDRWIEALTLSQQALDGLPIERAVGCSCVAGGLGDLYWLLEDGDRAIQFHTTALATARDTSNLVVISDSINALVQFQVLQGQLHTALATYQQGIAAVTNQADSSSLSLQMLCLGMSSIAYERNWLKEARDHLLAGIHAIEQRGLTVYLPFAYADLARIAAVLGDRASARMALQQVEQGIAHMISHAEGRIPAWIYLLRLRQVEALIALDDLTGAVQAVQDYPLQPGDDVSLVVLIQYYTLAKCLWPVGSALPCYRRCLNQRKQSRSR